MTIGFVGDIMLDRGVLAQIRHNKDYRFPFLQSKDYLSKFDILFGNLESVISDKGYRQGSIYSFRAPPKTIEGLFYAGFNILSIANNHSFDWGVEALLDSKDRLTREGIMTTGGGFSAYEPVFIEKDQTTFGFLAYSTIGVPGWATTETVPGIAIYSDKKLQEGIVKAKERADLIIVSIHYGKEYQKKPIKAQEEISKKAIDWGADIIIGHHPHVIQPVVEYNEGIIAYSLGNFVFDQNFSEETMTGLLLKVEIRDKKIITFDTITVKINDRFQPTITKQ